MRFTLFTLPKKTRSMLKAAGAASLAQSYAMKVPDNYPTADQCPSPAFMQQVSRNTNLSSMAGMGIGGLIYGVREGWGNLIREPLVAFVPIVNLMLSLPLQLLTGMEGEKCIKLASFYMGMVAIATHVVSADAEPPRVIARPAAGNDADKKGIESKDVKQAVKPTFDQRFQALVQAHQSLVAAHPHDKTLKTFNTSLNSFKAQHRCRDTPGGNTIINNPITLSGRCVDRERHLGKPNLPATDVFRKGRMEQELAALETRWAAIKQRFNAVQDSNNANSGAAGHHVPTTTFTRVKK